MLKELQTIRERYDLEIEKIVKNIKKNKAKIILLQFPDAIKPYATLISEEIENKSTMFNLYGELFWSM